MSTVTLVIENVRFDIDASALRACAFKVPDGGMYGGFARVDADPVRFPGVPPELLKRIWNPAEPIDTGEGLLAKTFFQVEHAGVPYPVRLVPWTVSDAKRLIYVKWRSRACGDFFAPVHVAEFKDPNELFSPFVVRI